MSVPSASTLEEGNRWLGVDLGGRRIGLALSDPSGTLASPLGVVDAAGPEEGLPEVCAQARVHQVVGVVVGLPLNMDGSEGEESRQARAWAGRLRQHLEVPVVLWDERLSTMAAERALLEGGMRRKRRRQQRDAIAATLILQTYLDAQGFKSWRKY